METIKPFDPWKSGLCTCPEKYGISPYTGCDHGCLYCYARSYIPFFDLPRPKKNFITKLKKDLDKISPGTYLAMANSSDPYLNMEKRECLTRQTLRLLLDYPVKLMIITKSSLVLRDLDILKQFSDIVVCITLTTLNPAISRKLEPGAPLPGQRLEAMEKLSAELPTVCRMDPLIYPLNTLGLRKIIREIKNRGVSQIITSTYKSKPSGLNLMSRNFPEHGKTWEKLYVTGGEKINSYTYMKKHLRVKILNKVRQLVTGEGLEFSTCREGFPGLNTKNCDGSSFFNL